MSSTPTPSSGRFNLAPLQKFGRSLMLPIASLPAAALLLRLGSADMLGADGLNWGPVADVIAAAGGALFDNLPLLFAVGVAIGLARKADGSSRHARSPASSRRLAAASGGGETLSTASTRVVGTWPRRRMSWVKDARCSRLSTRGCTANVPLPWLRRSRPSATSVSIARRTVERETR